MSSDELFFDGARYISAADAAEFSGHHPDYIARCAREKKILAKRIAKNWYIGEKSLKDFLVTQKYAHEKRRTELVHERRREYGKVKHVSAIQSMSQKAPHQTPDVFDAPFIQQTPKKIDTKAALAAAIAKKNYVAHSVNVAPLYAMHPAMDFLHRAAALVTAIMLVFGAYAFADPATARPIIAEAKGAIASGAMAILNAPGTFAQAIHKGFESSQKMFSASEAILASSTIASPASAYDSLAAASAAPSGSFFQSLARAVNTSVDGFVFNTMFRNALAALQGGERGSVFVTVGSPVSTAKPPTPVESKKPLTGQATVINQPVIERTIQTEKVISIAGITQEYLDQRLASLNTDLTNRMLGLTGSNSTTINNVYETLGAVARIENLDDVNHTNSLWTGGTITGATITGGSVTATDFSGVLGIAKGGTATSAAPVYGQLLVGNSAGGYSLLATSSLGIVGSGSGTPGGSTSEVQFNAGSGNFGGSSAFTFNSTTGLLSLTRASSTQQSVLDRIYVGGTATTTIRGDGLASTIPFASTTMITATTASSTNLIVSSLGAINCDVKSTNGVLSCGTDSGTTFGQTWEVSGLFLAPTTTLYVVNIQQASSTLFSALQAKFGATASSSFGVDGALTLSSALTIANGGTGTTTAPAGHLLYGGGNGVYQSVATSSPIAGTAISLSGTGALVGSALTINFAAPAGTGLSIPFASTTMITATTASTTNLIASSLGAAACDVKATNGVLSCGSDATGSGGGDPFTHPAAGQSATTSLMIFSGGASTTIASIFDRLYIGGTASSTIRGDGVASTLPFASTTMITATTASTTDLWISGIASGSLLKTTTGGKVAAAVAGTDYANFAYLFTNNATTSILKFTNGSLSLASTTIGNGTRTGGLTIEGWATTTGSLLVQGSATTTALTLSGLTNCTEALETDVNGNIICGTDATATGAANDFTFAQNYGVTAAATSSALWAQSGLFASSTSHFVNFDASAATITNATTTHLLVSSLASTSQLVASNSFTFGQVTGFLKATAGAVATSLVSLTSDISGILGVGNGGTGWGNITANTVVLGNGTGSLATTTAGTDGQVLALVSGVPSWVATTTLSTISGTLAVNKGGTGLTSYTLGDVLYASGTGTLAGTTTANLKATLALNNVENTALSTWAGSTNLTTLGTIVTGVWNGTSIALANGGTGTTTAAASQLLYGGGAGVYQSVATSSASCSAGILCSSFTVVGSVSPSITFSAPAGTALSIPFASTTMITATTASTTNLIVSSAGGSGTRCLQVGADGTVTANASACATSGLTTYDAWTHPAAGQSATTSTMIFSSGASTTLLSVLDTLYIGRTSTTTISSSAVNLPTSGTFQINSTNVLSNNTLGTGVLTSSLTTVGALNSGSITSGFGAIDIGADGLTAGAGSLSSLTVTGQSTLATASSTALSALDYLTVGRTASTTIRGDGLASTIPFASTTMITATTASTTNLWISGITSGSLLKTTAGGQVAAATAGTDYATAAMTFGKSWEVSGNFLAPTTTTYVTNIQQASSTLLSALQAKFGATASSSFSSTGALTLSSALAVSSGGTGLTSYTLGDVLYASGTGTLAGTTTANLKATLALNNVENTALSTWAGSTNLTTLGTITSGTWNGTSIAIANGGTGTTTAPVSQLLYGGASAYQSVATSSPIAGTAISLSGAGALVGSALTINFAAPAGTALSIPFASTTMITATTASTTNLTVSGTATSTFSAGIQSTALNITSTSASSTFANGIQLSGGCFATAAGTCLSNADLSTYVTQSGGAANRVAFFSGSGTNLSSDADLQFDGTTLTAKDILISHTAPILSLNDSDSSGTDFRLDVNDGGAVFAADIAAGLSNEYFAFSTNNDEKMRLLENGNLGIGTTSPFAKLSIAGDVFANGNLTGSNLAATGTLAVTGNATLGGNLTLSTLCVTADTRLRRRRKITDVFGDDFEGFDEEDETVRQAHRKTEKAALADGSPVGDVIRRGASLMHKHQTSESVTQKENAALADGAPPITASHMMRNGRGVVPANIANQRWMSKGIGHTSSPTGEVRDPASAPSASGLAEVSHTSSPSGRRMTTPHPHQAGGLRKVYHAGKPYITDGVYIYEEVAIVDIEEGDEVQSLDEKTGALVWSRVAGVVCTGIKQTYRITTEDGRSIRTTANHPYLVKNAKGKWLRHASPLSSSASHVHTRYAHAGWATVANLKEGDEIAVTSLESSDSADRKSNLSRYSKIQATTQRAEASLNSQSILQYLPSSYTNNIAQRPARISNYLSRAVITSFSSSIKRPLYFFGIGNWASNTSILSRWNSNVAGSTRNTTRPGVRFSGNLSVSRKSVSLESMMRDSFSERAYTSSSGSPTDERTASWPSALSTFTNLFLKFSSHKNFTAVRGGEAGNTLSLGAARGEIKRSTDVLLGDGRPVFENLEGGLAVSHGFENLPHHDARPVERELASADLRISDDVFVDDGTLVHKSNSIPNAPVASNEVGAQKFAWSKIRSIEPIGEEEVYDIEIEGTHNFIGNDIVAHNTAIFNSTGLGLGTTTPYSKLTVWGSDTSAATFPFLVANSASTTLFKVSNSGIASTTGLIVSNLGGTGTRCLQTGADGTLSANASACGSGSGGDAFTHTVAGTSATTTTMIFSNGATSTSLAAFSAAFGATATTTFTSDGKVGIGTTTPFAALQIATTTGKNLVLSDSGAAADLKHWLLSVLGGNFTIGTTTDTYATSTAPAFQITKNGLVGIATSTPGSILAVQGAANFVASATSTIYNGLATPVLALTSTTASSTAANGINLTGGCFSQNGVCIIPGGGGGVLLGTYSTSTVGTTTVQFTGAAGSAPSFSAGTLTLPSNTSYVEVETWGAGGGGSGNDGVGGRGGGGGGGYSQKLITSPSGTYYYNVGAGGAAGNNATGGTGGSSCFGTSSTDVCTTATLKATGGTGAGIAGGSGGTGSLGDVNLVGGPGLIGQEPANRGGHGGDAPRGGGGGQSTNSGIAGNSFGGGGGGGNSTNLGAAGGAGGFVVRVYTTISANGTSGGQLLGIYSTSTPGTNVTVNLNGVAGSAPSFSAGVLTLPSNASTVIVKVVSGGGGGQGSGTTPGSPAAGGSSSFGNGTGSGLATTTVTGGGAANGGAVAGGAGSNGDVNITGGSGQGGGNAATIMGGQGGNSCIGGGGGGHGYGGNGGGAGVAGAGGGGGGATATTGVTAGSGGGGGGCAEKLITSPSGTYYYNVAAGGAGGTAGGSGSAGGAGGSGRFTIYVYATGLTSGSVGTGTAGQFAFYATAGTNLTATSSIFVNTTNSFVGIGTTSPAYMLSVGGDVNIAAGKCYRVNGVCIGYTVKLAAIYATSTVGTNSQVVFTGASGAAPSHSAGVVTLPSNTSYVTVETWGAGGGGGGTGTGAPTSGGTGGSTTFGNGTGSGLATTTATGGAGGTRFIDDVSNGVPGGAGGTGSSGDLNMSGSAGGPGIVSDNGVANGPGGAGGMAPRGGGGGSQGAPGETFGGGGGGATATSNHSGAGAGGGGGYTQKLITSPSGTYYYNVGAGGTAGAAGGGGGTGGAGGAGGIVITVYATSSPTAAGNDYAEMFPVSSPMIGAADIVAVDVGAPVSMKLARAGEGAALAGVIATAPGQVLGDINAAGQRPVALAGRVPVKFSSENGPVKLGDRIAPSSIPGVGMKAGYFDDSVGIVIDIGDSSRTVLDYQGPSLMTGTIMVFLDLQQGLDINAIAMGLIEMPAASEASGFDFIGGLMNSISSRLTVATSTFAGSALERLNTFSFFTASQQDSVVAEDNSLLAASTTNMLLSYLDAVPTTAAAVRELNWKVESLLGEDGSRGDTSQGGVTSATSTPFADSFWNNLYTRVADRFGLGTSSAATSTQNEIATLANGDSDLSVPLETEGPTSSVPSILAYSPIEGIGHTSSSTDEVRDPASTPSVSGLAEVLSTSSPSGHELTRTVPLQATGWGEFYHGISSVFSATSSAMELVTASSSVATTTPWIASFADASKGLRDDISSLADTVIHIFTKAFYATVGIFEKVFAKEVHTDKLCVSGDSGETCITKEQLDALLAGAAASQTEDADAGGDTSPEGSASGESPPAPESNSNTQINATTTPLESLQPLTGQAPAVETEEPASVPEPQSQPAPTASTPSTETPAEPAAETPEEPVAEEPAAEPVEPVTPAEETPMQETAEAPAEN